MESVKGLLTSDQIEILRKGGVDALVNIIDDTIGGLEAVTDSLEFWRKRIAKEAWLPVAVIEYLKNLEDQCLDVCSRLRDYRSLLGVLKVSPDEKSSLKASDVERDIGQARRLIQFYRAGLETFLYQRSDPARRGQSFTVEALILFISDLYKTFGLSGTPMPLFSHTMSVDLFHEAYRLPQTMEFGIERWSLCAHEVGHKLLQGPLRPLIGETSSFVTDIILSKTEGQKHQQIKDRWKLLDLDMQVEELSADVIGVLLMGPTYYRASLADLRNSFSSILNGLNGTVDKSRTLTHPPQELRFSVILEILRSLRYSSEKRLWNVITRNAVDWNQDFEIMLKLAADPATDPFGGFFGELFNARTALVNKIRTMFPAFNELTLDFEKFKAVWQSVRPFLKPFERMDAIYKDLDNTPSPLNIIRVLSFAMGEFPNFEHILRLRAIRIMELKYLRLGKG